jgi:pSer/pThr/pTyr-binding forkhead associated (FHA) protein
MSILVGQNGFRIKIPADGKRRKLGRNNDCDITVPDPAVSRQHLFITSSTLGELLVENAGSPSGFYANGSLVQNSTSLRFGDHITFGSQDYLFTQFETDSYIPPIQLQGGSNSAQSISYKRVSERKPPRDIGPIKTVFASFVAIVLFGAFLREMESRQNNPPENESSKPAAELPSDGYLAAKNTNRSQTEIQAEAKYKEGLRDYYNKNYSRAIVGFKDALVLNPGLADADDFLNLAQTELKAQLVDLLKDGERSFANLQFRRSKGQALRALTILGEQIPSYSFKIVKDVISGRQIASTSQEDLMLQLPCDKSKEIELCKKAIALLKNSRKSLNEEEAIK